MAGGPGAAGGGSGTGGTSGVAGTTDGAAGSDDGGASPGASTSFKLAVIGSSTAAGEGASSASKGWVSLLASSLESSVVGDFTAVNLAVGGYTTSDLLPDGSDGNVDDAIATDPDLILVSLAGSNDLSAGTSTDTFLARLTSIRDRGIAAHVPVFFVSTAPKDLSSDERQTLKDWAGAMKTAFSSCWTPARSDYDPCFIDIFGPLADDQLGVASQYGAGDGIHVNDAGHAVIFDAALPIVKAYVCSLTECE
jgi:lysophospholipase L1-like esterase